MAPYQEAYMSNSKDTHDTSLTRRRILGMAPAAVALAAAGAIPIPAWSQAGDYPSKPIRFIVPFAVGGTTDVLARVIGQNLTLAWGQSVVIENKGGGGGSIGTDLIARAPADGYTVGMVASSHAVQPSMKPAPPYDALNDFSFITLVARIPKVIIGKPDIPASSLKELVELVKAEPDKYASFGTSGVGSASHLTMELINEMTGSRFVHIPYRGTGAALLDLEGGQLPLVVADISLVMPQIQAGKFKVFATTGESRLKLLPDVGAMNELLEGQSTYETYGIVGPKGMPADIVQKLQEQVRAMFEDPKLREQYTSVGMELPISSPDEYRELVKNDIAHWARIIESSGVVLN